MQVLEQAGTTARSELLAEEGPVAASIADAADRSDAGLIVMGSRRLTDLGGLVLGSAAHGVVRRTQRPVLLAEGQPAGEDR